MISTRVRLEEGRFTVFTNECLGGGNFGKVYKGADGDKAIAVKVLPQEVANHWNQCNDTDLVR